MGRAKRQAQLCSSSYDTDSSEFSDDEQPALDARRYQAADMQQGLQTRCVACHSVLLSWDHNTRSRCITVTITHCAPAPVADQQRLSYLKHYVYACRQFRLSAVRELHEVLAHGWSSAGKASAQCAFWSMCMDS
jgi:hypothetical protein